MSESGCPSRETLSRLLHGELTNGSAEPLRQHLLQCDDCSRAAESLHAGNDVTVSAAPEASRSADRTTTRHSQADSDLEINFLAPAQQPDEIGRLGDYRVLEVMGVGGMGIVFRAQDSRLERLVALKAMKPAVATSKSAKDRFLREARATAAIEHSNIVQIYQVGEDNGVPFIAMPYLRGESLQSRLDREARLEQDDIVRIGRQVADGLAAAHASGLIHRDIKPDNIWLEQNTACAKILDFGLVRSATDDAGLTQSGAVLGTPRYMAPEQAQGREVDHRADLFSLGSVLYRLATGRPPFVGSNVAATLLAVVNHELESVTKSCPELDEELAALIMRLLAKDPNQRPQSAAEVAETLVGIQQRLGRQRADGELREQPSRYAPSTAVASESVSNSRQVQRQPQSVRRSTAGLYLACAMIALLGIGAAAVIMKIVTQHGTILVEIEDSAKPIRIRVNQDRTLTVDDPNDGHPIEVSVDSKGRQLRLEKQGFEIVVKEFSLESPDGRRVKVTFDPLTPPAPRPSKDPNVLTVAQDGSGQFASIADALAQARKGMTIRVLDDAVYDEPLRFLSTDQSHLTLESQNRATLRATRNRDSLILIAVPKVRVDGFRFHTETGPLNFCTVGAHCSGTAIENNVFSADLTKLRPEAVVTAVSVENAVNGTDESPLIVRDNQMTGVHVGVRLRGVSADYSKPELCRRVIVADNRFEGCFKSIQAEGDLRDVLIGGNLIVGAMLYGIQLEQLIGKPQNIVVANNTALKSQWPLRVWDDGVRDARVYVVNNLSLDCSEPDWVFFDSGGDPNTPRGPGDARKLVKEWRFSCNYREGVARVGIDLGPMAWIPPSPKDVLAEAIPLLSRDPHDPNYLRPAKDSPLATEGAGRDDPKLPKYIGARPPPGETPWDWSKSRVEGPEKADDAQIEPRE